MQRPIVLFLLLVGLSVLNLDSVAAQTPTPAYRGNQGYETIPGFFDMTWMPSNGQVFLVLKTLGEPFLYQTSLARGVGSNELGLDRGQLGSTRVVTFERVGSTIFLVERNQKHLAKSRDAAEVRAAEHSFPKSVIWGFKIFNEDAEQKSLKIEMSEFLMRDSHGIAKKLKSMGEGSFRPDKSRSAVYEPHTKTFIDNTEMEAMVTFVGNPQGRILPSVVPDPSSFTVHLRHSFIRLPNDDYEPLPFDPRSGLFNVGFVDYGAGVGESLEVKLAMRHRLKRKDPHLPSGEAEEAIVYYVDSGVPEPIRSALVEGASWWNQAFEASGFKNAFRVEILPEEADPMDVRYNVIQWVHRSTRGWSYGSSVVDPRTGEILKGHVSLGSQRIRQDYLIAEGLLAPYEGEMHKESMLRMSLARIRQLAAHEVGHTLGLAHNFAASTQDRSSVMDYPFPLIKLTEKNELDLSAAYALGIGDWDKAVINYAYRDFKEDGAQGRAAILRNTLKTYHFVSDSDSRGRGTAHPDGNLWDNGDDAVVELKRLLKIREHVLGRFCANNIKIGRPMATLEEVLVPIYLLHRYQLRAVSKLIGGQRFTYALRGDGQMVTEQVSGSDQKRAIGQLMDTIDVDVLRLPPAIAAMIPPRPPGFWKSAETFPNGTGVTFDSLGCVDSAVALTLDVLLNRERAARLVLQHARDGKLPGFNDLLVALNSATFFEDPATGMDALIQQRRNSLVLEKLMTLATNKRATPEVRSMIQAFFLTIGEGLRTKVLRETNPNWISYYRHALGKIAIFLKEPGSHKPGPKVRVPMGSPIGCGG